MNEYALKFDDFVESHRLVSGTARWLAVAMPLSVVSAFCFTLAVAPKGPPTSAIVPIYVCLVLVITVLLPLMRRRALRRIYDTQHSLREATSLSFDENELHWTSASGTFTMAWANVYKTKIGTKIILLFESPALMHPVPCSAFESPEEKRRFMALCASAGNSGVR